MSVETENRHIHVVCPKCENNQRESALVVSTLCQSCGEYLQIDAGKVIVRPTCEMRFATADKPPIVHEKTEALRPTFVNKEEGRSGFFRRMFANKPNWRDAACYHCGNGFKVIEEAQSTQCTGCGGYISLKNFRITSRWHSQIQTCGDVMVERDGSLTEFSVDCRHLTIQGVFSTDAKCSGTLTVRSHGKIVGDLYCSEFRVECGLRVEVQGEVYAKSVFIDGNVKARINCEGTITLAKKAHLQGVARASAIVAKAGAKHTGALKIISKKGRIK